MSVDNLALIASLFGVLIPVILVIVAVKKYSFDVKLIGYGAVAYLIIFAISSLDFFSELTVGSFLLVLVAAVITKLFDTVVKYLLLKLATRKEKVFTMGIAFGLGFGAMQEFVGTGAANGILALIIKFNLASSGNDLLSATQAQILTLAEQNTMSFVTQIILIPFTIMLQVGISTMIMKSVSDKNYRYFFIAFAFQAFISLMIRFMGVLNPFFADIMIVLAGVFGLYMTVYLRNMKFNSNVD